MEQITRAGAGGEARIVRVGADLAKRVIQVHAVDAAGAVVCRRALRREAFMPWCARLPAGCVVAMEISSGAHHWARRLLALGLVPRLMSAQLFEPYRSEGATGKNDANDAAAICEAASRPSMRFVPVKSVEQQSMLRMRRLTRHDSTLVKILGESLPEAAYPWKEYRGIPRLVVMNGRTALIRGEMQSLDIIAIDQNPVKSVVVKIRPLGKGHWKVIRAENLARDVWKATLPSASDDFEYQVIAKTSTGSELVWPATAPKLNQTVVVREK